MEYDTIIDFSSNDGLHTLLGCGLSSNSDAVLYDDRLTDNQFEIIKQI